jgi:hypothetical protein
MKTPTLWFILGVLMLTGTAFPQTKPQVYSTWETMEMDRLASLWLIKKFIDPGAMIRIYPQGTMDMEGIQVDTPTSNFRRTQQVTAYESLLQAHTITDPALVYIGQLVRDVEINIWGAKKLPESQGVNLVFKGIFLSSKEPKESMEKGFIVMDGLYKTLHTGK